MSAFAVPQTSGKMCWRPHAVGTLLTAVGTMQVPGLPALCAAL
jgi:hypothetical protein